MSTKKNTYPRYENSLCFLLQKCAQSFQRDLDSVLEPFDLSAAQYAIIDFLFHNGPAMPSRLCEHTRTNPGAMTRMIGRLQSKGLIEKVAKESDRRAVQIHLSRKGEALIPRIVDSAGIDDYGNSLSTPVTELDQLKTMLSTLLKDFKALKP